MTLIKLASLIAKREGKKHQASVGDIREILKIIIMIESEAHYTDESDFPSNLIYSQGEALYYKNRKKKK
jgi:hypothetical protein